MILSTRLKNIVKKAAAGAGLPEPSFALKDISINGEKRGCSGFVTNPANGTCVYVITEKPCVGNLGYMYRYADGTADFRGYLNHWAGTPEELADGIAGMLGKSPAEDGETKFGRLRDVI